VLIKLLVDPSAGDTDDTLGPLANVVNVLAGITAGLGVRLFPTSTTNPALTSTVYDVPVVHATPKFLKSISNLVAIIFPYARVTLLEVLVAVCNIVPATLTTNVPVPASIDLSNVITNLLLEPVIGVNDAVGPPSTVNLTVVVSNNPVHV
jgi:hypothetical protein